MLVVGMAGAFSEGTAGIALVAANLLQHIHDQGCERVYFVLLLCRVGVSHLVGECGYLHQICLPHAHTT